MALLSAARNELGTEASRLAQMNALVAGSSEMRMLVRQEIEEIVNGILNYSS